MSPGNYSNSDDYRQGYSNGYHDTSPGDFTPMSVGEYQSGYKIGATHSGRAIQEHELPYWGK